MSKTDTTSKDDELLIEMQNIDVKSGDYLKNLLPAVGVLKIVEFAKRYGEQMELRGYKRGLLYNKRKHTDFSELGADVSIQAEIRRTNAALKDKQSKED